MWKGPTALRTLHRVSCTSHCPCRLLSIACHALVRPVIEPIASTLPIIASGSASPTPHRRTADRRYLRRSLHASAADHAHYVEPSAPSTAQYVPVLLPANRHSEFGNAAIFPSVRLRKTLARIDTALSEGDVSKAYSLYLRLRQRYANNALARDTSFSRAVPLEVHEAWLHKVFQKGKRANEVVSVASQWLKLLEQSPDAAERPTPSLYAIVLRGLVGVASRAESPRQQALRSRAEGRIKQLAAQLMLDSTDVAAYLRGGASPPAVDDGAAVEYMRELLAPGSGKSSSSSKAEPSNRTEEPASRQEGAEDVRSDAAEASEADALASETIQSMEGDPKLDIEVSSIPTYGVEYLRTIIQGSLDDSEGAPMRERQLALETAVEEITRLDHFRTIESNVLSRPRLFGLQHFAAVWQPRLAAAIEDDRDGFWRPIDALSSHYPGSDLRLREHLTPDMIAGFTTGEVLQLLSASYSKSTGPSEHMVVSRLGRVAIVRTVLARATSQDEARFLTQNGGVNKKLFKGDFSTNIVRQIQQIREILTSDEATAADGKLLHWMYWPTNVRQRLARQCLEYLLRVVNEIAKEKKEFPLLTMETVPINGGRTKHVIQAAGELAENLQPFGPGADKRPWNLLPMLIPPRPWTSIDDGAYLRHRCRLITNTTSEGLEHFKLAARRGQMNRTYDALNVMGQTPWKVNESLLRILVEAWNRNLDVGKLISRKAVPSEPLPEGVDAAESRNPRLIQWKRRQKVIEQLNADNFSNRVSLAYAIQIALCFRGRQFFLPYGCDFRGRVYPLASYLSPTQHDFHRALLLFAHPRPLGTKGLHWLKVQVANMCGVDKVTFEERVRWVDEHMPDIYESVDHPLDGKGWWQRQEKPWQCLSNCQVLVAALRSPDPSAYESCMPVQLDGTCNGLQHYAALSRDIEAAKSVGLAPADRPGDVYSDVARNVARMIDDDSTLVANGGKLDAKFNGISVEDIIPHVRGRVTRKLIKQPVMTSTYGVTLIGASMQIRKQMDDKGMLADEPQLRTAAAFYLATKVLDGLEGLFARATEIKRWFISCTMAICRSYPIDHVDFFESRPPPPMTVMSWTTEIGISTVQPYRTDREDENIFEAFDRLSLQTTPAQATPGKTDSNAQARAFPPNFIHSLDASHMMRTALAARTAGLTFSSVHDSFWTHAGDTDQLATLLREEFIKIYSKPILQDLRNEWLERYKGHIVSRELLKTVNGKFLIKALGPRAGLLRQAIDVDVGDEIITTKKFVWLKDLLPQPPTAGEFDIERVRESKFFFS